MRTWFARFGGIVGAWGFLTIFNFIFDDVLYPLAIFKWGALRGGGGMAILATIQCILLVLWYERMQKDWLGVNVVEDIKKSGEGWVAKLDSKASTSTLWKISRVILYLPSRSFLLVLWALKKNDMMAFIALNIFQDPFVTLIFLRHGRFDGLRKKDWMTFTAAVLFSNGYWIARNTALIEVVSWF